MAKRTPRSPLPVDWEAERLVGDPEADAAAEALLRGGHFTDAREAIRHWGRNADLARPASLPEPVRTLAAEALTLPAFADAALLRRAGLLFDAWSVEIAFLLLCKSLPECYTMRRGAAVLETTGRLMTPADPAADPKAARGYVHRVMMTLQFAVNVMSPGGFDERGRALLSLLQIRLVHACIRRLLLDGPAPWDVARFGGPINQEDLTFTLTTFSSSIVRGLRRLGVRPRPDDVLALHHLWRVAGVRLGIREALLPRSPGESDALQDFFFASQGGASDAGRALTASLVRFAEGITPGPWTARAVRPFMRHLTGRRAAWLGLTGRGGSAWILALVEILLRLDAAAGRLPGGVGGLMRRLHRRAVRLVMKHFTEKTRITLDLPAALRER